MGGVHGCWRRPRKRSIRVYAQRALSSLLCAVGAPHTCKWKMLRLTCSDVLVRRALLACGSAPAAGAQHPGGTARACCPARPASCAPHTLHMLAVYCGSTVHVSWIQEVFGASWQYTVGVLCPLCLCHGCSACLLQTGTGLVPAEYSGYSMSACCMHMVAGHACLLHTGGAQFCLLYTTGSRP